MRGQGPKSPDFLIPWCHIPKNLDWAGLEVGLNQIWYRCSKDDTTDISVSIWYLSNDDFNERLLKAHLCSLGAQPKEQPCLQEALAKKDDRCNIPQCVLLQISLKLKQLISYNSKNYRSDAPRMAPKILMQNNMLRRGHASFCLDRKPVQIIRCLHCTWIAKWHWILNVCSARQLSSGWMSS